MFCAPSFRLLLFSILVLTCVGLGCKKNAQPAAKGPPNPIIDEFNHLDDIPPSEGGLELGPLVKPVEINPAPGSGQQLFVSRRAAFGGSVSKNNISVSPDGRWIASTGAGPMLSIWDARTGQLARQVRLHDQNDEKLCSRFVVFSPDGRCLAAEFTTYQGSRIHLFDTATLQRKRVLRERKPMAAAFSPDSKTLAVFNQNDAIRLWDLDAGQAIAALPGTGSYSLHGVLAFSPDGKQLATGGKNNTIQLLNVQPLAVRATLPGHQTHPVNAVAFSPDGKWLASSASGDKEVRIWDVAALDERRALKPESSQAGTVHCLSFSPGGKYLATAGAGIRIWDFQNGRELAANAAHGVIHSFGFLPAGNTIASVAAAEPEVVLFDIDSTRQRRTEIVDNALQVIGSPDGKHYAIVFDDRIELRELATGLERQTYFVKDAASRPCTFASNGTTFAYVSGAEHKIVVRDVMSDRILNETNFERMTPERLVFAADGESLAIVSQQTISIIKLNASEKPIELKLGSLNLRHFAATADGQTLILAFDESIVQIWNVNEAKPRHVIQAQENGIRGLALAPDGSSFVTIGGDDDPSARVWETATGKLLTTLTNERLEFVSVSFMGDGKTLLTLNRERSTVQTKGEFPKVTANMWDVESGVVTDRIALPHGSYRMLTVFPGAQGFAALHDKTLHLWDLAALANLQASRSELVRDAPPPIDPPSYLAVRDVWRLPSALGSVLSYTAGGTRLAMLDCHSNVRVLDPVTGKELVSVILNPNKEFLTNVIRAAFSPDGRWCALACRDKTIRLWDLHKSIEVYVLRAHTSMVRCVAFSPDGKCLVSGGGEFPKGELYLWDLEHGPRSTLLQQKHIYDQVSFSPDGATCAVSWANRGVGAVDVWDIAQERIVRNLALPFAVASIAYSSDSGRLVVGAGICEHGQSPVTVWDIASGAKTTTLAGHTTSVGMVGFVRSGRIISAGRDLKLSDSKNGRILRSFNGTGPFALSPDGKTIVCAGSVLETINVLDIDDLSDDDLQIALAPILKAGGHVRRMAGTYEIVLQVNGRNSAAALASLQTFDKPFALDLSYSKSLTDNNLAPLAGNRFLRFLTLSSCSPLTAIGLQELMLPELEELDLSNTPFDNSVLTCLTNFPRLTTLNLKSTKVSSAGLAQLNGRNSLRSLDLTGMAIGRQGLLDLARCSTLTRLNLSAAHLTASDLAALSVLPNLRVLSVSQIDLGLTGLTPLIGLSRLEELDLFGTGLTDKGLQPIGRFTNLIKLNLLHTAITNEGMATLATLVKLRRLTLAEKIDDEGLAILQHLKQLQELDLRYTPITDDALATLREFPELEMIVLADKMTEVAVKELASFLRLRKLCIGNALISEDAAQALREARPDLVIGR